MKKETATTPAPDAPQRKRPEICDKVEEFIDVCPFCNGMNSRLHSKEKCEDKRSYVFVCKDCGRFRTLTFFKGQPGSGVRWTEASAEPPTDPKNAGEE